jgi:hypothetical protein
MQLLSLELSDPAVRKLCETPLSYYSNNMILMTCMKANDHKQLILSTRMKCNHFGKLLILDRIKIVNQQVNEPLNPSILLLKNKTNFYVSSPKKRSYQGFTK